MSAKGSDLRKRIQARQRTYQTLPDLIRQNSCIEQWTAATIKGGGEHATDNDGSHQSGDPRTAHKTGSAARCKQKNHHSSGIGRAEKQLFWKGWDEEATAYLAAYGQLEERERESFADTHQDGFDQ